MISAGSIVGKKEFEGPLGNLFDMAGEDNLFGGTDMGSSGEQNAEGSVRSGIGKSRN